MPRKQPNGTAAEQSPDYILTTRLIEAYRETWLAEKATSGVSEMHYSRLSVVAMTMLAGVVGVDVGMSRDQFVAVCAANFDQALAQAPRFG